MKRGQGSGVRDQGSGGKKQGSAVRNEDQGIAQIHGFIDSNLRNNLIPDT